MQNREACFALVLLADVVSVVPRVMCHHDARGGHGVIMMHLILLGKDGTFVPVELFDHLIECRTQMVGHIAVAFGKPNGQFVAV